MEVDRASFSGACGDSSMIRFSKFMPWDGVSTVFVSLSRRLVGREIATRMLS
jgi:hypothetical protein